MPQSLSQIYVHLIFSTKGHHPWITPSIQDRLFPYLANALNANDCAAIKVGGYVDHVHLLFRLSTNKVPSKVIGDIKSQSTKWLKAEFGELQTFSWQAGYGQFSVSPPRIDAVSAYIAGQAEHHKTVNFKEEFRRFLDKQGVEYDEGFVWDSLRLLAPIQGACFARSESQGYVRDHPALLFELRRTRPCLGFCCLGPSGRGA